MTKYANVDLCQSKGMVQFSMCIEVYLAFSMLALLVEDHIWVKFVMVCFVDDFNISFTLTYKQKVFQVKLSRARLCRVNIIVYLSGYKESMLNYR